MDWIVVAFVGLVAIALAVAIGVALDRDRELDATRVALGRTSFGRGPLPLGNATTRKAPPAEDASADHETNDPTIDVPTLARRLRDRLDAAEFELDQQVRNGSYLADLMGVGIVRLDERGTVELANAAAHILLHRQPGSLAGRTALETFLDGRVEELIATARAGGAASGEFRLSGPDGPILVVRARRSPVSGVWIVLEDVSELRRLQQIRTQFVDNLSHELRTPLSTVSLLAETLARDADAAGDGVPARMRERIGKIEIETGHLVQMVNELLDLARIEGGGPLVLLDDVDLGRVAADASERLRLFAERQGLRLVVDVAPNLPPVRGDGARLGQVVVNLVHNALKFGRPEDRPALAPGAPAQRQGMSAGGGGVPAPDEPADGPIGIGATGSSSARNGPDGSGGPAEVSPAEVRVSPAEVRVSPAEVRVSPAEDEVSPAEVRVSPAEVRVSVRAAEGDVILSVEDHGVGIPAADRSRIFERFYKVDRVRVRGGGTGLGLAIARHVIEQHGGRIEVESEEGRGSTFNVVLPAAVPMGVASPGAP